MGFNRGCTIGDTLNFGGCEDGKCWELDVTPEEVGFFTDWWCHSNGDPNECLFLAIEMRKKRVEIKLRNLGERDQKLFAAAKHKEISAWLHHKTVRKVASGRIPEHALMRCRWILS